MKQCIKYFMIILLGVLLYDGAAQAAGISCTLISNDSERCFLSQAPTSHQQNIRNIYNHFSSMPLYMDNVDSTQVPGNKSFFILLNYFRMYWLADSPTSNPLLHPAFSYYVFGLRKIII